MGACLGGGVEDELDGVCRGEGSGREEQLLVAYW